jgi:hypothetical protein
VDFGVNDKPSTDNILVVLTVLFNMSFHSVSRGLAMLLWIHYFNRNKLFNGRSDYPGKRIQGSGVGSTRENS